MYRMKPSVVRMLVGVGISGLVALGAVPARAAITSNTPSNGSTLTGSSQFFEWTGTPNVTEYWIWVGTTIAGGGNGHS